MLCAEYRDLVAAHVDAQLTAEEASLASAHVDSCAKCTRLLETQRAFRQAFRGRSWIQPTPEVSRRALLARLEAAEGTERPNGLWSRWWSLPITRLALAAAVGVAIVAVVVPLLRQPSRPPGSPLFDTIVGHYRAVEAERVTLSVRTDDPIELRAHYLKSGAFAFTNTVVDLEPLGFVLVGGTVTELGGKKSTLSVYRGRSGMILCHRIAAADVELPPGGEVIGGDHFYTVDGVTICVHREGDVVCFMASAIPRLELARLLAGHV